jgi:hypothetical protein
MVHSHTHTHTHTDTGTHTDSVTPPPRWVLLFSGHMVDAPSRPQPRFPPARVPAAAAAIGQLLADLQAGPADIAYAQGAAGGDLLFAQACQQRGVRLQLLLPFDEEAFMAQSVLTSGDGPAWWQRYGAVKAALASPPRVMATELGPLPAGADPFVQCNQWLLATALQHGADKLHFICLWDGGGADGPGGTRHMIDEVRRLHGRISWIDTRTL